MVHSESTWTAWCRQVRLRRTPQRIQPPGIFSGTKEYTSAFCGVEESDARYSRVTAFLIDIACQCLECARTSIRLLPYADATRSASRSLARRFCDFAIHRVAVTLVCRTRTDLLRLHEHLLAGQPKRAVYLRSLTLLGSAFMERSWQEDPNWIFPKNTYEYSNASLVGDILQAAPNLTHVMLEHSAPLFQHDPRIRTALASMTRLARLELCHLDSNALPLFQELRSRPRVLHLSLIKVDSAVESYTP
ncbi:hypothetical protein NUW54_g11219 [Trametes sanguinea]|uniref:Uncharacterized protein n=1 Tax=Trametes sanguinea TaxID=158606 RepID=A0ACC1NK90_9APHY|nr:hypothetical protein NUW54_g11219 [Trametes sanguinea]